MRLPRGLVPDRTEVSEESMDDHTDTDASSVTRRKSLAAFGRSPGDIALEVIDASTETSLGSGSTNDTSHTSGGIGMPGRIYDTNHRVSQDNWRIMYANTTHARNHQIESNIFICSYFGSLLSQHPDVLPNVFF